MLILLYGCGGWIGKQVLDILKSNTSYTVIYGDSRIDNKKNLEEEIKRVRPTHIMSFVGRTHGIIDSKHYQTIDYLEQPGKLVENIRDNLFGPVILGLLCVKYGIHLTYLGTGCIFEYDDSHPYPSISDSTNYLKGFKETDRPNFFGSSYSIVKGYTDEIMHLLDSNVLNIRIRMPISADRSSRNFITKITTYKKICSIPNSMTVLPELLPIMIDMAQKKITGTINLTNPGIISHNEILEMYREIIDPDFTWENFSLEEQAQILAAGRSNNYLDTDVLQKMYPDVMSIKDSVRQVLIIMKKQNTENIEKDE